MISVDWSTKVISIPKADLTLIQSLPVEIRELNLNDFHLEMRGLEDDETGIPFLKTHNHAAPVDVGGVTLARVVEIINGYTVTFEDGQYAVNVKGGNSNLGDNVNVNQVSVRSFNSAGLVTSAGIEAIEYENAVWINVTSSNSGSLYPTGTLRKPVNNLIDAKIIAAVRGFDNLEIIGNITFQATDDVNGFLIHGENPVKTVITLIAGCQTDGTQVVNSSVTGVLNGDTLISDCKIYDLTYVEGCISNCLLTGVFELAGSETTRVVDCTDGQANGIVPTVDMGGSGRDLVIARYTGDLKITNFTGSLNYISVDFLSGKLWIDSTCTAGYIYVRGVAEICDEGSSTVYDKSLNVNRIVDKMWDEPTSGHDGSTTFGGVLLRLVGLIHENHYVDQSSYSTGKLTSARIRTYHNPGSVGTDNDVLATYNMTATYEGDDLKTYKVVKA